MNETLHWRSSFWKINISSMLAFAGLVGAFNPTLSLYALDLKATPLELGIIFTIPRFMGAFLRLPSGALSTHIGRKKVLVFAAILCTLAPLFLTTAHSIAFLFLAGIIFALTNLYGPAAVSLVHDLVPAEKKHSYLGIYSTCSGLGSALGPLVAGFLIDSTGSYIAVFWTSAVFGLSALLLVNSIPKGAIEGIKGKGAPMEMFRDLSAVARDPRIVFVSLCRSLQSLLIGAIMVFFPWYGKGIAHFSATQIGVILATLTFSSVFSRAISGQLKQHQRHVFLLAVTTVLSGVLTLCIPHFIQFFIIFALCSAIGVGEGICQIATLWFVSEVAGARLFGAAIGLLWGVGDLGIVVGRFLPGFFLPAIPLAVHYSAAFGILGLSVSGVALFSPFVLRFKSKHLRLGKKVDDPMITEDLLT